MLFIEDVDGDSSFSVQVLDGENYSVVEENILIPEQDFNGNVIVSVSTQDASGLSSDAFEFSLVINPVNDAPVISSIQLEPSIPQLNDNVVLTYVFFDVDGDEEISTSIKWFKDGVILSEYQDQTVIPASATLCNEVWFAALVPSDGILEGDEATSLEAVICGDNTPPVWSSQEIVFAIDEDETAQIFSIGEFVSDSEQSISQLLVNENSDY